MIVKGRASIRIVAGCSRSIGALKKSSIPFSTCKGFVRATLLRLHGASGSKMDRSTFRSFSDEATNSKASDGRGIGRDCSVAAWVEFMTGSQGYHLPSPAQAGRRGTCPDTNEVGTTGVGWPVASGYRAGAGNTVLRLGTAPLQGSFPARTLAPSMHRPCTHCRPGYSRGPVRAMSDTPFHARVVV